MPPFFQEFAAPHDMIAEETHKNISLIAPPQMCLKIDFFFFFKIWFLAFSSLCFAHFALFWCSVWGISIYRERALPARCCTTPISRVGVAAHVFLRGIFIDAIMYINMYRLPFFIRDAAFVHWIPNRIDRSKAAHFKWDHYNYTMCSMCHRMKSYENAKKIHFQQQFYVICLFFHLKIMSCTLYMRRFEITL